MEVWWRSVIFENKVNVCFWAAIALTTALNITVGNSIKCLTQNRIPFCLCRETNGVHIERYRIIHSFHWHVQNAMIPSVLRSFFHSVLLCNFSCHPSPTTILPPSLTSSCHLFLGLPFNLFVPKFIYSQNSVHERLGSWTIRFTNKFSEHKASWMTYCVLSYEHASRQHRGAISWEYQRRQYS